MKLAFIASGLRPGGAYDPEGAFSYMKAMVTLHYYNYMNMVRLNLVKWLRGLNHRDHQEYKEKCNTSLELIPTICFTSTLSVATLTLKLHTQIGKNRCARVIVRHLRACSPRTGSHVRSSTVHPVPGCARPHLTHSDALCLGVGMQF